MKQILILKMFGVCMGKREIKKQAKKDGQT